VRVTETTLQQLLGGPKKFRVPLFQLTYTWKEREQAQLWRDVLAQYELSRPAAPSLHGQDGHFIGSFVLAPAPATATQPAYLVVDGQQRLTTLTLALCALRDAAVPEAPTAWNSRSLAAVGGPAAGATRSARNHIPQAEEGNERSYRDQGSEERSVDLAHDRPGR
jgi:hypothetical protein